MDLSGFKPRVDSSHWYTRAGEAAHQVPRAKGDGMRATTLADARKFKLYPSATNVLGVLNKPALVWYVEEQMTRAVLANPQGKDEPFDYYLNRMRDASKEVVTEAANLGTKIHAGIEDFYNTGDYDKELIGYVSPAVNALDAADFTPIGQEVRVVNHEEGYAGTADLIGSTPSHSSVVVDAKSRKSRKGKFTVYSTDRMQLAAYWVAHFGAIHEGGRIGNLYISTSEPGLAEMVWHDGIEEHYQAFCNAAALWRYENRYDPR